MNMFIKGSLLVLLVASVYAEDVGPGPDKGGDKNVSYPPRRWDGGGRPSQASGVKWKGSRGRGRPGQTRKKPGQPQRKWGRPGGNNRDKKPLESESWDTAPDEWVSPSWGGDAHDDPTVYPTAAPNYHQVCDKTNRNICCDLGSDLSEATKRNVCQLLGCDYDKCQWRTDGYSGGGYSGGGYSGGGYTETIREYKTEKYTEDEPSEEYVKEEEPAQKYYQETPKYISNKVEPVEKPTSTPTSWKDDGHNKCDAISRNICCNQDDNLAFKERKQVCDDIGCIYEKCGRQRDGWKDDEWKDDEWKDDGHWSKPTPKPTSWKDDGHNKCDMISRNICCNQDDNLTVKEKKQVCDDIGCIYDKCGWQKDGYDDDAWEDDGYNDDKSSWKKDGYDDDSKPSWNDDGYDQKNKYNKKDNKESWYDFKNSYKDDECSGEDRQKCCTANRANQRDVCERVGCNMDKCYKKEGGWYDTDYEDKYKIKNNNNQKDKYNFKNDYVDNKCTDNDLKECCSAKQWQICQTLGCNMDNCDKSYTNNEPAYGEPTLRYVGVNPSPQYSGGKPTMRPTYRSYHDSSAYGDPAARYDVVDGYSDGYKMPTMRPTYRAYSTNYDVNNNAYGQNVYPNPDYNANMYPNPIPNDGYQLHYVGGYGN